MKILVCVSHVPDTIAKINFTPDNKTFDKSGVTFILNPYDEIALSKALDLAVPASGTVTVINVGDASYRTHHSQSPCDRCYGRGQGERGTTRCLFCCQPDRRLCEKQYPTT